VQSIETRGVDDTFVSRVRGKDGKLVWAKVYGEQDSSEPVTGVVADGKGGVYVTGTYYRTVEFDREKSAFTLDEISDNDIYLGHLVSNGGKTASGATWDWLMPIGGGEDEVGGGIALGPTGDIYLTGSFGDRVEFQPGVASSALTSIGERDAFVARYSRKGKLVWARQIGGDDAEILGKVVAVDSSGAVYAAGDFNEKVYITQGRRTVTLNAEDKDSDAPPMNWMDPTDVYVTKFTASGKLAYAKHIGGEDAGMTVNGIAAAANGDVTLTGGYAGTADFNPGRATFIRYTSDEKREMDAWWVKLLG
ncbi:MAG TPA: hypothetical protein VHP11_18150, partial [Tepidisphaeraceae bacterium]|nr:hypothetical protein [Tepidisphaeraceae bacterium]